MFPQIFGKYILERELASGGMAVVYLATLRGAGGFEKRLVVKQIRAELASDAAFVERFVAEAKTTVGLSHPNIVPVYELGVEQGVYFIAMELAQGVTLAELLRFGGRLSPEEGAYLGVEISRALDYAHRKAGVVHRDVTPRNVLIDDEGAVRLIDFGIAAPVTTEGGARERVYGSPGHMPPEQIRGGRLTPATDVFAVGALLLEAWSDAPPFRRKTRSLSDAALELPVPPPSAIEPTLSPLDELIARAVALNPEERPQTPEDLARPLRDFLRTADLGDIARRLGERVRRARRESKTSVPPPRPGAAGGTAGTRPLTPATPTTRPLTPATPATPASRTGPETLTFAARDEVSEWTRPPSVPPPKAPAVLAPVPVAPPPSGNPRGSARTALLLGASVAVAAGIGALVALGVDGPRPELAEPAGPSPRPDPSTRVVENAEPGAPAAPDQGRSPSAAVDAGRGSRPISAIRSVPSAATGAPRPSASAEEKGDAVFTFTSDLPARVTLDGASVGSTPIRGLRKPPGRHVITFVGVALDEHLGTTVAANAGQSVSVHAEFTRAVPALRVH